ncbi:MAG TPA: hypothetical protein VGS20_03860 [Candidatus Acidoferrales bacterium]|nr:hypothetical protein [Candidatus Acidoferrales bacterium]
MLPQGLRIRCLSQFQKFAAPARRLTAARGAQPDSARPGPNLRGPTLSGKVIAVIFLLAALLSQRQAAAQDRARGLVDRTVANQHRDDDALYFYERVQRRIEYDGAALASDNTYRLVPTGTGRLSLLVKRGHQPVNLDLYRKELRDWQEVLTHAIDPNDPRQQRSADQRKRMDHDRAELIDAIGRAFRLTWLGETTESGRTLARIRFDPDPAFVPPSRETELLRHVRATVWIDEQAAQLARGEAEVASDISAGGGLIGKIYAGGRFAIEQREAGPGVWLPARVEYSLRGRKFFIGFNEHKVTVTGRYRYIGVPLQALQAVRADLASGRGFPADP